MTDAFSPGASPHEEPLRRKGGAKLETTAALMSFLERHRGAEAVKRLAEGDRLDLLSRAVRWMKKRCYLLDPTRIAYQTLSAVVAIAEEPDGRHEPR